MLRRGSNALPWYLFSEFYDYISKFGLTSLFAPPNETASVGLAHVSIMKVLNTEQCCVGTQSWIHNGQLGKGEESTLANLLRVTGNFQATDPRDRLYALLGLARDREHPRVAADYRLSVEEVYVCSATYFLEEQNAVWILYRGHSTDSNNSLPSWVPDWRKDARSFFHFWRFDYKHPYCADGSMQPKIRFDQTGRKLIMSGVHFDTIAETTEPCASASTNLGKTSPEVAMLFTVLAFLKKTREMAIHTLRPSDGEPTSKSWYEEAWDAVWRTLCGNVRKQRYPAPDYWVHAIKICWERHLLQAAQLVGNQEMLEASQNSLPTTQESITAVLPNGMDEQTEIETCMSQFRVATTDRRFCMTENK